MKFWRKLLSFALSQITVKGKTNAELIMKVEIFDARVFWCASTLINPHAEFRRFRLKPLNLCHLFPG
jgi:hypothetical protein